MNVGWNVHSGSLSTVTCAFRFLSVLGTTEESVLRKCMYNEQCQMNGSARMAGDPFYCEGARITADLRTTGPSAFQKQAISNILCMVHLKGHVIKM